MSSNTTPPNKTPSNKTPPTKARAVIVGGGIVGLSVAYHLARLGWKDVVLLERKRLTSGTTWHAAGLIAQLRATQNMTRLAKYSQELYGSLEAETGLATGFRRNGSITVALTEARKEEILRQASMGRTFGVEVEPISASEVKDRYPHLKVDDVLAAVYLEKDGQGDPANIAGALAKGATMRGVRIFEGVEVTGLSQEGRRVNAVEWKSEGETGTIEAESFVNCAGMWARELGAKSGVSVPLHACEHFYIVTDVIEGLKQLPVLRVPDECAYYKEDAGKLMLGAFELNAKPWGMNGIPSDFEFDQLPADFDHFEPILEKAIDRVPLLGSAGIHTFFNGPESFTPDNAYHLGLAPWLDNYWVAAGYNSVGIQSAGGAGMALAQWMNDGEKPFDLGDVDICRMHSFQSNKSYLYERTTEVLGLLYADHFPYRQKATARGVRRSPVHEQLLRAGAVFGEVAGWERPNWYADEGQLPQYQYSWQRQNWFENSAREHLAIRNSVGLYDMTSFGKIRIEGPDAEIFLNRLCSGEMAVPVGRIVYSQMLNRNAGIEADVTVARLTSDAYLMVTPAITLLADIARLTRLRGDDRVAIVDVTSAEAVFAVMGPRSRDLLQLISPNDFSSDANPFGTWQMIELGMGIARAHRISYVGELGWELYVPSDMAAHAFEKLREAGAALDLKLCGMHAVDSARIEKAFRHFGHDITCEDHILEAGLGFAIKKSGEYIGREAVMRKREQGLARRMLQFRLKDPEPLLYHAEAILRDGQVVGYLASGNYGHSLGSAIGLGYVPCDGEAPADLLASSYQIEIAGVAFEAVSSLRPMYDPSSIKVKG